MKEFTDLIHFGYLNKNGRVYGEKDIDMNDLSGRTLYGEIGYPNRFQVSMNEVSHQISNLEMYGDALYGEVKILETPKGRTLKELIKNGTKFVFRPRGSGTVNPDGTVNDYKIYTFDAVLAKDDAFDRARLRGGKLHRIINKINENILRNTH